MDINIEIPEWVMTLIKESGNAPASWAQQVVTETVIKQIAEREALRAREARRPKRSVYREFAGFEWKCVTPGVRWDAWTGQYLFNFGSASRPKWLLISKDGSERYVGGNLRDAAFNAAEHLTPSKGF